MSLHHRISSPAITSYTRPRPDPELPSTQTMTAARETKLWYLDLNPIPMDFDNVDTARPISPGELRSERGMNSPTFSEISWDAFPVPDRPLTADATRTFSVDYPPSWTVPLPGQYILFSLKPPESLIEQANDEQKIFLEHFSQRRCLGLVVFCHAEYITVLYVSPKPPPEPAGNLYVPIAPLGGEAPNSRPALRTTGLFPKSDHMQWTAFGLRLVPHEIHPASEHGPVVFQGSELSVLEDFCDEDKYQLDAVVESSRQRGIELSERAKLGGELTETEQAELGDLENLFDKKSDFARLRIPEESIPATVYCDLRGEYAEDPVEWVRELHE